MYKLLIIRRKKTIDKYCIKKQLMVYKMSDVFRMLQSENIFSQLFYLSHILIHSFYIYSYKYARTYDILLDALRVHLFEYNFFITAKLCPWLKIFPIFLSMRIPRKLQTRSSRSISEFMESLYVDSSLKWLKINPQNLINGKKLRYSTPDSCYTGENLNILCRYTTAHFQGYSMEIIFL